MKLQTTLLKEGETPFQFSDAKDAWLKDLMRRIANAGNRFQGAFAVDLRVTQLDPDYYFKGKLEFEVQQNCARCAEAFPLPISHPFEIAYEQLKPAKTRSAKSSEESDELDINFFEGTEIDLAPLLEEQFFLSLPYQAVCQPDCLGICQQCGQNLNMKSCSCEKNIKANPFSVLNHLKH